MKAVAVVILLMTSLTVRTNDFFNRTFNGENKLFIITLDGFRWQEVFGGADSALLHSTDAASLKSLYWASTKEERRKKLLPFFWNVIARNGELHGNRLQKSFVNAANPYALSYPGYNELFTGSVDPTLFNNGKAPNHNPTFLETLNATPSYKNKVAAFASWDAFPYILNQAKQSVYVNSGFEELPEQSPNEVLINQLQNDREDQKNTRYDELTYLACRAYIEKQKPSVVFLGFGGTDEAAHEKNYAAYLQEANKADRMIGELWHYLQSLPEYRGKTSLLITTDHGRGHTKDTWHSHGMLVGGSSQTWLGLLGPAVPALGERKASRQLYLKDVKGMALQLLSRN